MSDSPFPYTAIGPSPIQLVVPIAVKNFTASSITRCFFIIYLLSALFSPPKLGGARGGLKKR